MIDSIHQSYLNMWLRCGTQFEFRYMQELVIPPGIFARRGAAVHKAAEINHRQKIKSQKDLPLNDLKDAAHETYWKYITEGNFFLPKTRLPDKGKIIQETETQVLGATEVYHQKIAPTIQPVMIEETLSADLGFELPLTGIVDCVSSTEEIVDLKTMKRKNQAWADRELQPTVYSILYDKETGNWPKGFRYEIMVPNKKPVHDQLKTNRGPQDVEILKHYISAFLRDFKAGIFRPADLGHWVCSPDWCGYYQICKYSRR